ncbi:uncharacterized protein LOC105193910 [Solenopsis invicta]|uniref:uncharacterized protein LOC105193910 n=1 Tax=Solenopsis invicta TaxID=13686 RepID=UPI000595E8B0|nr:uncharacterized protein LOC105193910 [Solenopsis invicta]
MLFYALSAFSVAAFGLFVTGEYILPVTTCNHDSVDYSACLKHAMEEAWPRFTAGLPEIGFPPMDPMTYKYGETTFTTGELHGVLIVSNVTVIGMSQLHVSDVRTYFHDEVFHLEIDTLIPHIFLHGDVMFNGLLNVFKLYSKGHFNLTIGNIKGVWNLTGHVINDTWTAEHFLFTPSFAQFKAGYKSVIGENQELMNLVITFLNEFWPSIYRLAAPYLINTWDSWLANNFANKFFSKFPFSEIFP